MYFVCVGGPLTVVVSLSAAAVGEFETHALSRAVADDLLRPGRYDAGGGRRRLALPVSRAIRHVELLRSAGSVWDRSTGSAIARWAMFAIILLAVWKNFGYNMVIFVAGLQSIPEELFDAARIDGAGTWHTFWNIKLPLLAPTFFFVGVTTMIGYFQLFAEPYVMTQGGPLESTYSLVMYMYEQGFRFWRIGFASAIAFVLFVIILAATVIQVRLQRGSSA